jgi:U3 small nucleolar RNA-associated protein 10
LMLRSSEESLPRLTLLAEILGIKSLPGSLELTTHLLQTLNKVVQSLAVAQADVIYIQQLLMSAIESTSSMIKVCI